MRASGRCAAITAAGLLLTVGMAGPAAARPEAGRCPTPFTPVTQAELALVLADLDPSLPLEDHESAAAGAFANVNKNDDELLCYIPIGKQGFVNVIDNVVPDPTSV